MYAVENCMRREKVCLGCISETVRCRKLILGSRDGLVGQVSWYRDHFTLIQG